MRLKPYFTTVFALMLAVSFIFLGFYFYAWLKDKWWALPAAIIIVIASIIMGVMKPSEIPNIFKR